MTGFFFFKQKTAYEMRISDWSSDVCSSDLGPGEIERDAAAFAPARDPREHIAGAEADIEDAPRAVADTTRPAPAIGRASCWERVCQYVEISVVAVSFQQKTHRSQISIVTTNSK